MSYEFFIARRYLASKKKTGFISIFTFISIAGILIGVAALIFVLSMMNGFEKEVRTRIIGTIAHINIFPAKAETFSDYESLIPKILEEKQVQAVAPFIYSKVAISSKDETDGIIIRGILPQEEEKVTDLKKNLVAGSFDLERESKENLPRILLGATLSDQLNVRIGDTVVVYGLNKANLSLGATPKVAKFKVGGIFETGMYEYDSALGYILLSEAQKLFNLENSVTGLEVKIDNFYHAQQVAKQLEQKIGPHYMAVDWMQMHKNLFSWMSLEKYAMFLALSLIVAVAAFNIISTLIMIVLEKKKEIGILKSLGATSQSIMKIFMFKGLVVGLVGTSLGIIVGFTLGWLQKTFNIISLPSEIYFISSLPVDMRAFDFVLVALASMGIAFLATLYPAKKAASLNPVEAIRFE
ncbi:MAG: hypothetical protein A2145_06940 [candidate division Zixibacteria bacterium RBG_16_40_9]|nr:MAG: hypothetical protein A2145_06940 [candidate division Zixibacteria bacterium RBG_16_40_9]